LAIATEAVKNVYQYVLSSREPKEYVERREELAAEFRARYGSDNAGKSNALPHFIGVFDTVAALGTREFVAIALSVGLLVLLMASGVLWFFTSAFWEWFVKLAFGTAVFVGIIYGLAHTRFARRLKAQPLWRTFHLAPARSTCCDQSLTIDIPFARHALSIDENRASFDRVPWGEKGVWRAEWLKQEWFAGNHSDIGGSYPENESRLSDIALGWMVDEAKAAGLKVERERFYCPRTTTLRHDSGK
jgi:uncharacterized protein (DUF2235 family)